MTTSHKTTTAPTESWIVLSHGFNMDGRAASHTITDKIPFLQEAGINPIIISAVTGNKDKHLEHHQVLPAAPSGIKFDLRHLLKQRIKNPRKHKLVKSAIMIGLLPFYAIERAFIHLESQWSWFWPAYRRGLKIIRERGDVTVIYSTGGANSAHHAGYLLAKKTGLPWIAEVHDPMIHEDWNSSRMAYNRAAHLEACICRKASLAWWFTENALDNARKRHPELGTRGMLVLPGAESPDFANARYRATEHFNIGHFGSLSSDSRNFKIFFQALAELLEEKRIDRSKVRVHVYGTGLDATSAQALQEHAQALEGIVTVHGRLERDPQTGKSGRQRVVEAMREADALLLLHGADAFCAEYIPSKLYEYLWTQRPILGLTWQNPTLDAILRDSGNHVVTSTDVPAIKDAIAQLYQRWHTDGLPDNGHPSAYTTQKAVAQIVNAVRASHSR